MDDARIGAWETVLRRLLSWKREALCAGWYKRGDECCAIGVVLPATRAFEGEFQGVEKIQFLVRDYPDVATDVERLGMTLRDLEKLQSANDYMPSATDKSRYARMVGYVRKTIDRLRAGTEPE